MKKSEIGQIGGGKRKVTGFVDVAMIQSLNKRGKVDPIVANYGHIIVDECHHISATTFEQTMKQARAAYVTGLSATVRRRDGHHPIIFMQCGPVRHEVTAKEQAARRSFSHRVVFRETGFRLSRRSDLIERPSIHDVFREIVENKERNDLIIGDVLSAVREGRFPVVITERRSHLDYLADRLSTIIANVIALRGGMTQKQRALAVEKLRQIGNSSEKVLLATGSYLGEGFDDPRLDTLFLAFPISWKGKLAQYVGRLNREYEGKTEVVVYDYVDGSEAMLKSMAMKRRSGYRSLGYEIVDEGF